MKHTTALLSLLLLAGTGGAARAQTTAPKAARAAQLTGQSTKGYCLMKDGNMLLVENGKMAPMTVTLTMGDGSLCMPDGTCQRKDGTTVMLKEGQSMLMNGKITRHPDGLPGPKMRPPKM
jgi:hypothetical protein